jgi:glycine/D-amino acid oxidase-like deaminating enzyme
MPDSADVVVVGAGITGLTTAVLLAERGVNVVVIERNRVGSGTSGRTTAKVSALHGTLGHRIRAEHGTEALREYVAANTAGLDLVASWCAESSVQVERRDAWTYATDAESGRKVESEHEALTDAGLATDLAYASELPFDTTGAVRLRDQLQLDPLVYLHALAERFVRAGGRLIEQTHALAIDPLVTKGRLKTRLSDGHTIASDWVVLATLMPFPLRTGLFAAATPARSSLLACRLGESAVVPQGMYLSATQPTRSLRTAHAEDGTRRLLVGGGGHPTGKGGSALAHVQGLAAWAQDAFPITEISHRWSAQDFMSTDLLPHVGHAGHPRMLVATGYGKWGLTNGSAAGLALADTVTATPPEWAHAWQPRIPTGVPAAARLAGAQVDVATQMTRGWVGATVASPPEPEEGEGSVGRAGLRPRATSRVEGVQRSVSAVCTHLGGIVRWNDAERSWDCPLHGSRFGPDGEVRCAPAVRRLSNMDDH